MKQVYVVGIGYSSSSNSWKVLVNWWNTVVLGRMYRSILADLRSEATEEASIEAAILY